MHHKAQVTHFAFAVHPIYLQKILLGIVCTETLAWWCVVVYLLHRECYEHALEIREKLYGHKHPSVASVLVNLGNLWKMKDKAISHYQEALAIEEEILGPNHLEVCHHSVIRISMLQIPIARQICQHAWAKQYLIWRAALYQSNAELQIILH